MNLAMILVCRLRTFCVKQFLQRFERSKVLRARNLLTVEFSIGKLGDPIEPKCCTDDDINWSSDDKERVKQLRHWYCTKVQVLLISEYSYF